MQGLATGVGDVGRGLAALRARPALWKWLVAPAIATLLLVVGAVLGIAHAIDPLVGWLAGHLPGWLASIAGPVLRVLVVILLISAALFGFTALASAIAGPFCEQLSEQLEADLTGRPAPLFSLRAFLHGALLGAVHAVRRLVVALVGLVLMSLLGFVPVIGTIGVLLLAAWFAASAAAYDCYDAVLGRRAMAYRDKLAYLSRHRGRTLGLGLAVAGLLLVPGLNLIALGIGAAGATLADLAIQQEPRNT